MPLGARTWYPAQDERNGIYQLQKAEERAALEHAEKLRRIDRIREIRLRRDSGHDTPCGSSYNLLPKYFVPGVEHHPLCKAAGGKALDSGSLSNPETFVPAAQPSAHRHAREDQMIHHMAQLNSNAKHENSIHGPIQSQNNNDKSKNQGSTISKQNSNIQNSNHQNKGNQQTFGNDQGGKQHKFPNQPNGNQKSSGIRQDNTQKSSGSQQSGKEQNFLNQQKDNQKISGNQQSGKEKKNLNQQKDNQTSFGDHQRFGIQEDFGNHQNRNKKISEGQCNAGAQQKFAAHEGSSNGTQRDRSGKERGFEQQYPPRKEDRKEIHSRNSGDHFSKTKNEPRGSNTPGSLGIGNLNEDRNVRFSQSSNYPVIAKVNYLSPQKKSDGHGSFLPRVEPRFESRTIGDNILESSGDGWNRIPGEPHHLRFQDHYDYLLGKEIHRVLSLAGLYPEDASYGHRRSSFSGF